MRSDRVRAKKNNLSTLNPAFKTQKSSFLQPLYQDRFETEDKQLTSSDRSNLTSPSWSHSFGRMSVLPLQAKLTIGQPGDKYEQEADRVAEQVMRMPEPDSVARRTLSPVRPASIQRLCAECEVSC